ncbi:hypothetical protein [Nonomuraea sp. B19D2]|uniref:hypothetical protein n=1 Tax=Nonomuraea sp. B19D2 TaxID=3159561 RepID=UPI0032DB2FBF
MITPLNQIVLDTCSNAALVCDGPQTDAAVRRAIYYGMNRSQINALAFEGTSSEISPGFGLLKRDTAAAKPQVRKAPIQPDMTKASSSWRAPATPREPPPR